MTIPTGPFPAAIDFADVQVGMVVRGTATWAGADSVDTVLALTGVVAAKDAAGITLTQHGWSIAADPITALGAVSATLELMEAFTGIPGEPSEGAVIKSADGTVYQRQATGDPLVSQWVTANTTTPVAWSDITGAGDSVALA